MIILVCSLLITVTICSACIIFSQRSKLKETLSQCNLLKEIENAYRIIELENAKLSERCNQLQNTENKYTELFNKYSELEKEKVLLTANLEQERKNLSEKIKLWENAEQKLTDTFKAVGSDALSKNNQTFIDLAKSVFEQLQEKAKSDLAISTKSVSELVDPIKSALEGVGSKLGELEKSRIGAYEALRQQVNDLIVTQNSLKTETNHLVSALKSPSARGRWGEMQLRRVVELAGMTEHCDFEEQVTSEDDNVKIRPDMVIYFPKGQQIVVDAKAPLSAYLEALETENEHNKKALLKEHAKQIRTHVSTLANKKYWSQFQPSPEFVIMFLPGEIFFSVAAEQDPSLIEFAMQERVIISTPTILLALLHTIALGWRQEYLAENAKQIVNMGKELYERLSGLSRHIFDLGKNISSAVSSYNRTVASLESRVFVTARKFKELESHEKNIIELSGVDESIRQLNKSN